MTIQKKEFDIDQIKIIAKELIKTNNLENVLKMLKISKYMFYKLTSENDYYEFRKNKKPKGRPLGSKNKKMTVLI